MEIWGEENAGLEEGMVFLFYFIFLQNVSYGLGLYT